MNWLERTELLLTSNQLDKLKEANVLVVGLGGVGAYAAEMIARAGVGKMTIIDGDTVEESNINRQLPALYSNIHKSKAEIMADRLMDINPDLKLTSINEYIRDQRIPEILEEKYDYVVDAIDTLSPKVYLVYQTMQRGYPLVSSMGAGGKIDPSKVVIARVEKSFNCKLARILRKRLRKLGIKGGFDVVFSPEDVPEHAVIEEEGVNKKSTIGTISYMPAIFGMFCASVVIKSIISKASPEFNN